MSQFDKDSSIAKSAISQLFSSRLAFEFEYVIDEGQYDQGTLIDDIEDEDDSNIIDGLITYDENQINILRQLIIQIFKYHKHDISSFKLRL